MDISALGPSKSVGKGERGRRCDKCLEMIYKSGEDIAIRLQVASFSKNKRKTKKESIAIRRVVRVAAIANNA